MSIDQLSANDRTKFSQWMESAMKVTQEMSDLKEGLADVTKALAEEYGIKPAVLNKALRMAMKSNAAEEREGLTQAEEILVATGRG